MYESGAQITTPAVFSASKIRTSHSAVLHIPSGSMETSKAKDRLKQVEESLATGGIISNHDLKMSWPKIPAKAAYLLLNNARRRNALSLSVLRDLKQQILAFNTSPEDGRLKVLPPFKPDVLPQLESALLSSDSAGSANDYRWLIDAAEWQKHRGDLPKVIVLRSEGTVFCSGHDLSELRSLPYEEIKEVRVSI